MRLSIVLACYNGAETLADQLDGLAAQEWSQPWEVVFVDNRSTDNSRAIAEQYKDRLPNLRVVDGYCVTVHPFSARRPNSYTTFLEEGDHGQMLRRQCRTARLDGVLDAPASSEQLRNL